MLAENCKLVSDWQNDVTYGLKAIAHGMLGATTWDIPIFNSVDEVGLMKDDLEPPTVPAWCLWVDSSTDAPKQGGHISRKVKIAGALVSASDADPATMSALANTTMRAAVINMDLFNQEHKSANYRLRNGVLILKREATEEEIIVAPKGTKLLWGISVFTMLSLDTLSGVK